MLPQTEIFLSWMKVNRYKKASNGGGGGWIWSPGRTQASDNGMDRVFTEDNQTEPSAERIDDYLFACSKVHASAHHASQGQPRTVTERSLPVRSQKMC